MRFGANLDDIVIEERRKLALPREQIRERIFVENLHQSARRFHLAVHLPNGVACPPASWLMPCIPAARRE